MTIVCLEKCIHLENCIIKDNDDMYPSHLCFLSVKKIGHYSHFIEKALKHNLPTFPQDKRKQVQTCTQTAVLETHNLLLSCTKANFICPRARRYDRTVQNTSASLIKLY